MKTMTRKSNFELLRIISMIMIVASHYAYHGGLLFQDISTNQIFAQLLKLGGKLGVTCFVLISAYFLVDSKFKIKNIIKICLEVSFYAIILLIFKFVFTGSLSVSEIIKSVFAPIYNIYWFPTAYIGLYLTFPLLNIIINKAGDKLKNILIIFTVIMPLISFFFVGSGLIISNFTWFIYLYFIAAYIKKYNISFLYKHSLVLCLSGISLMWFSSILLNYLGVISKIKLITNNAYIFSEINSPLMLLSGICLFICFMKMNMKSNYIINYIGSITFAVYLLHDNAFFSSILWKSVFKVQEFYFSNIFIVLLDLLFIIVALFAITAIIEFIRTNIEKLIFKIPFINKAIDKIDKLYYIN